MLRKDRWYRGQIIETIMGNAGSDLLMCSGRGPGMDYDQGMGTIPGYYAGGYDNIRVCGLWF